MAPQEPPAISQRRWLCNGLAVAKGHAQGAFAAEFSPLGPGVYMIEPEELGVWTDVELTGLEAVAVTFRPRVQPTAPNQVTRVAAPPYPFCR